MDKSVSCVLQTHVCLMGWEDIERNYSFFLAQEVKL